MWRKIKWAYQRVRYGYDETVKWEFDSYLARFIKPLREFCQDELIDIYDGKRKIIFEKTLKLIKDFENMPYEDSYKEDNAERRFWAYFGEHIGYYWN